MVSIYTCVYMGTVCHLKITSNILYFFKTAMTYFNYCIHDIFTCWTFKLKT